VFGHEADQFGAWSVVGKLSWLLVFVGEHGVEKYFTPTATLYFTIHVEVKHTEWLHFNQSAMPCSHEQLLIAYFNEADTPGALCLNEESVVVSAHLLQ